MKVIEINKENFQEELINSNKKVLADFNAEWCGPCKMLKPIIDEIAEENDKVKVVSINIDDDEELAEKYNISSIPCLILFDQGKELKRNVGFISKNEIETFIGE